MAFSSSSSSPFSAFLDFRIASPPQQKKLTATTKKALLKPTMRSTLPIKITALSSSSSSSSSKETQSLPSPAATEELKERHRHSQGRRTASKTSGKLSSVGRRELGLGFGLGLGLGLGIEGNGKNAMARGLVLTGQEKEAQARMQNMESRLRSRISTFTLPNGMKWIVVERHNAPVVACRTYAAVGASKETNGCTGIAHLLEHLAFKGTKLIGTRDSEKEAALLEELDELFYSLQEAQMKGRDSEVQQLRKKFLTMQAEAASLSIPNEYGALIERQGGIGLNAQTTQDSTEYFVSLPANKLELWMALESGRFLAPVFRDLYSEKEVVKEERRLRIENTPYGKFTESFTMLAFPKLAYGRPVIGYPDDFESIGRREVTQFFEENYSPQNITCAVVGDVDPLEVERLAQRYFGMWESSGTKHCEDATSCPWHKTDGWNGIVRTDGSRFLSMKLPVQPFYMEGYYRPSSLSIDDPAISVIDELISGGRLSRFFQNLILPGNALSATSVETYPGDQQPCLFLTYGTPSLGVGTKELASRMHEQVEGLAKGLVKEEELFRVKKAARASLLEIFGGNQGLAQLLCRYEATTGSFSNLFQDNALIEAVTPSEIQRVASLLFNPQNRVQGCVETTKV